MDQRLCGHMILVQDGVIVFLFHRGLPYRKRKILTGNRLILQWYLILTYLSAHLLQLDNLDCHIFMLVEQNWIVKCSWLSMLHNRVHWLSMSGEVYVWWFWPGIMYVWQFFKVQVGIQSPDGISTLRQTLRRFSDFLKLYAAVCWKRELIFKSVVYYSHTSVLFSCTLYKSNCCRWPFWQHELYKPLLFMLLDIAYILQMHYLENLVVLSVTL